MMFKFIKNHLWLNIISTTILVVGVLAVILYVPLREPDASKTFSREVDQDLAEAAALGDKAAIDSAIAAGADINVVGRNGIRPLEWVYNKSKVGFEYLLELGADPNAFNNEGVCAVLYTSLNQDPDWLCMVLEHGGDPNIRSRKESLGSVSGVTAIFHAVQYTNLDSVKLLIEHGADINILENNKGMSPLIEAVDVGNPISGRWLLEHGADWTVRTTSGVGVAEAALRFDYDPERHPEYAEAHQWILDFLEEQGVDLAAAEARSREIYGPNFRRFSRDND